MKAFLTLLTWVVINFSFLDQAPLPQSKDSYIFNLISLEGKEVMVKIYFDDPNDRLIVELNTNEKMCIQGARDLCQDIKILDKKFIELQIVMRGGSGESVHRYLLVCVSENKLYRSVDVFSLVKNLVEDNIEDQVIFGGLTEKNNSYEISITGDTTLHFDFNNKIFFNGFEYLNGLYNVNSDKDLSSKQINFNNEKFPSITVNLCEKYICIKNNWYVPGNGNYLMELTSSCN